MALLRNLEQSLSGLVEGTIGRVFRTEVRPTEIARKLAREMEINKRVSLSRTYAPTDYIVYLSPDDRSRYAGVEGSIAEELGAYLLEHARRERLVLVRRPLVEFRTDKRLHLGEFGIEARTAPISAEEAPARPDPVAAEPERRPAPAPERAREPDPEPYRARASAPEPVADQGYADEAAYDDDQPAYDDYRADAPLGSAPASGGGYEPPAAILPVDDAPYVDPYAGDPFNAPEPAAQDAAEFGWEDAPARNPEPSPPAKQPGATGPAEDSGDWLDPVEDWNAPAAGTDHAQGAAPAQPLQPSPPAQPQAPQPRREQPFRPGAPNVPGPSGAPVGGSPWIDPTLSRPSRPQFAPPVIPPRQPAAPPTVTLLVDGTAYELTGDRVVLGRSRTADIVVSDPSVSRQHCELLRDGGGWIARDLGSTNGCELNGEPLTEPRRLASGMRIKLGHAAAIIEVR